MVIHTVLMEESVRIVPVAAWKGSPDLHARMVSHGRGELSARSAGLRYPALTCMLVPFSALKLVLITWHSHSANF